jgi:ElaB/YqjD/DUF883 family membrane-anchored ribosome-binding protein
MVEMPSQPTHPESSMDVTTDKLMQDLKTVVVDAEDLARARIKDMTQDAEAQAREAAGEVNRQVHDNPWTAVGVAAGVGVLIGLLLGRR